MNIGGLNKTWIRNKKCPKCGEDFVPNECKILHDGKFCHEGCEP